MYTLNEFIYLANRSTLVFIALMKGSGLNVAAQNRNYFQRALTKYAKRHHGNGKIDKTQLMALGNLAALDGKLWRAFKFRACKYKKIIRGDSIVPVCSIHGEKIWCRKEFEDWMSSQNY